nr:HAMP domain-containing sensor histidine kinase [uncultured Carboxylicivirga sp.]
MKKKYAKISPLFFVLVILIIPTTLFTVLELSSMNDQEKLIEDIYKNQLEAVLFSINQFADDNVNAWINDLEKMNWTDKNTQSNIREYIQRNPQCQNLFLLPFHNDDFDYKHILLDNTSLKQEIIDSIQNKKDELKRQFTYLEAGYRKLQGIDLIIGHNSLITFVTKINNQPQLGIILLDARQFISDVLSPRMQRMAGDNFILSVKQNSSSQFIFSTLLNTTPTSVTGEIAIWLLPDYSIGIQPKGLTIGEVAKTRAYNNILYLALIDILLIIGAWFFHRNIKREINLAKIKSDFVSNVSHEIRTPLALISMYAETLHLNRVNNETKRKNYYSIIYKETQRLSSIVNNILNFSRIESGKRQFTFSLVDINDLISEVMKNYAFRMESKGFEAQVQLNDDIPLIDGDAEAISEAITNLLDNAVKYSKHIKQIDLTTSLYDDFVKISVSDYGIGIPVKEQKHIFDKFYRVTKGALAHHAKGSGLGLSIVLHIMQAHKGSVNVISEEHKGSTFTLQFPISKNI